MDQARTKLEFAQALGYGTKKDFDKMYEELREIQDKTADNKFGTGWFSKIKASIADFLKSSQPKSSPPAGSSRRRAMQAMTAASLVA
jgi:hypothetical protein